MINTYYACTTFCTAVSLASFYGYSRIQSKINSLERIKEKFNIDHTQNLALNDQTTQNIVLVKGVLQSIMESKGVDISIIQKAIAVDNYLYTIVEPITKEMSAELEVYQKVLFYTGISSAAEAIIAVPYNLYTYFTEDDTNSSHHHEEL